MHEKYLEKAWESLNSAECLLRGGYYNDCVSRAYYAMFFGAKALLSLKKIYPKKHSGVITKFGLEFVKNGFIESNYGHKLTLAKELRERADYDIDRKITEDEAKDIFESGQEFLEKIEKP